MEEAASKKLLERNVKEDNGSRETVKEWGMSPASVSLTLLFILDFSRIKTALFFSDFWNIFLFIDCVYYVLFFYSPVGL